MLDNYKVYNGIAIPELLMFFGNNHDVIYEDETI